MQTTTEKQKTEEYSIIKLPKKVQNKSVVVVPANCYLTAFILKAIRLCHQEIK